MRFSLLRPALSLALVLGAAAGCASTSSGGHPGVEPRQASDSDPNLDPVVKLLQTKAGGLIVSRNSNGELAVQLAHGPTSFFGSNDPLYLIDDTPFRPGPDGALTGINPYDIESIKALTKPEETTMYGVRGANGVIVIKLKKPGRGA